MVDAVPHIQMRQHARAIFQAALKAVSVGDQIARAVCLEGSRLIVRENEFDLAAESLPIYAIAIGKAAHPMAAVLDSILGSYLKAGVATGVLLCDDHASAEELTDGALALPSSRWSFFRGGHPLPNEASMTAAQTALALLRRADRERALVIFLISGGGSAMIERPRGRITLDELREMNRLLISCGASIAEVNTVRRAVSAIKGGGLAQFAPHAAQISLIVSDTNAGDEGNVASGPTIERTPETQQRERAAADAIIVRYALAPHLPSPILDLIERQKTFAPKVVRAKNLRRHYVLTDNHQAMETAARTARNFGYITQITDSLVDQPIADGVRGSLARLRSLYAQQKMASDEKARICLISGGEFACPVRGTGRGGRNAETVLRWALALDAQVPYEHAPCIVVLSGGTDGIDGNSPAAGALADEQTVERAHAQGLDARRHLAESDAYTFFDQLDDAIITGPTGTNVRDLRVMLAA